MPSGNVPSFTDYAGNQTPDDLVYIAKDPFGLTDDRKSTLNDLFSVITKNITDGAVRFQEFTAPALSATGEGSLYFDDTDKTFKGSRNGSAYDDLLFGNGANQQVAVFTSVIDTIAGYAPFYYNNVLTRLYITDASFAPTMEISKTGTTPALFKAFGGQGYASLGNWSATAAAPAYFNFYRGASGPAFPTSGMDIGSIRFRPASDTGDVPTTIGGARIDVRATENATLGVGGGVGLTIYTAANGQVSDTQRMLINSAGVVMLGVNSATITTNAGTDTKTVLGELTTYDSDAIHQIGNPSASDAKILVIQGNAAQTKALTEWQNSAGTFLFSIGAFGSHSYGGTTGIAVSAAGQGRIYFDSASNTFQVSQNGGAYVDLVNILSPGGTTGSIQYNNGANLIDGDNYFLWDTASATIQIGAASVLSGKILLRNSTNANTLTIQPGATGGNITFTLPTGVGSAGQYLQTDGAGILSWQTVSGGSLTVGTTAIASGTVGRVLYEATGNVLGEAAGITYQTAASPTVTITAQNAGYIALRVVSAATPTQPPFAVSADNGTTNHFLVTSTGAPSAPGSGTNSERFGASVTNTTSGADTTAVGNNISLTGTTANVVAIGTEWTLSSFGNTILIGHNNTINSDSNNKIFIGNSTTWSSNQGVVIGNSGTIGLNNNSNSIAIGNSLNITSNASGIFIGSSMTVAGGSNSIVIGYIASSGGQSNTFIAGSSSAPMDNVFFGKGYTNATPTAYAINGTGGSGSNIAGAGVSIYAGRGTGTGAPGTLSLQFARPGSSGSSLNTLSDSIQFSYLTDSIFQTWRLKTTTTAEQDAASIVVSWTDTTHATRTAVLAIQIVGNAAALSTVAEFDVPVTAGDTALSIYDLDNATLERVSVGAADSGGTGFKVLRIPN